MSFSAKEASIQDGKPIYLYRFTLGDTVWRYTSASRDVDFDEELWKSVAISDEGFSQTGETQSDQVSIIAPSTVGPAVTHMGTPPANPIQVAILHAHMDDGQVAVVYSGEIAQVGFPMPGQCKITCATISASLRRDGLRLGWQRNCPYALYDQLTCKVNKADFAVELRITDVQGFTVFTDAADDHDDGYFAGGLVQWSHPVRGLEYRAIEQHAGNQFVMFGFTDDMFPGMVVTAYPGCRRITTDCVTKFNNLPNYGGIPNFPGKSPFDGTPVF